MTFAIRVQGGTNAGRRIIRTPKPSWIHVCVDALNGGVILDASYARCPHCGRKRP